MIILKLEKNKKLLKQSRKKSNVKNEGSRRIGYFNDNLKGRSFLRPLV